MSANDRLVRLPDGTWVRPSAVVSVTVMPERRIAFYGVTLPAKVDIRSRQGTDSFILAAIQCESYAAACEMRDQVGRMLADAEDAGKGDEGEDAG